MRLWGNAKTLTVIWAFLIQMRCHADTKVQLYVWERVKLWDRQTHSDIMQKSDTFWLILEYCPVNWGMTVGNEKRCDYSSPSEWWVSWNVSWSSLEMVGLTEIITSHLESSE
jgi:hypothetical protein